MSPRARIDEVLRLLGIEDHELLGLLRDEGLFLEDELEPEQADELRVAACLMRDLGVNAAGVEVALHLRRRLRVLQRRVTITLEGMLEDREEG